MNKKIVSFGEIMLRLTPPAKQLIEQANSFDACFGGCESNVLVCLSSLGDKTEFLTALPPNSLGETAAKYLRYHNVGTNHIIISGDRLGTYYLEEGVAERPSNVIYDRKSSSASFLDENAFDFEEVFKGCSLFHISGISFAISESSRRLSFQLIHEAKKRNIPVSFDFNHRKKLWTNEFAATIYKEIVPYVDIVFAAERDVEEFLGMSIYDFLFKYPCKTIFIREREAITPTTNTIYAKAYHKKDGKIIKTKIFKETFTVYQRVGSGDAFAGGILHVINQDPDNVEKALQYGMSCLVLKHSLNGDALSLSKDKIKEFINKKSNDINR